MQARDSQSVPPQLPAGDWGTGPAPAVTVELETTRVVNYAMQQNDVPVVTRLRIANAGDASLRDLHVRITTDPGFSAPWELHLAELRPGEARDLGVVDLPLSHSFLAQQTERVAGALQVEVAQGERSLACHHQRLDVLAYDEWSGSQAPPEMLASFVTPNHPAVEAVLADAAALLGEWTGDTSLSGYQSGDRSRVLLTVGAIYAALQGRGIRYSEPPASFEDAGQKIRLPDRILEHRLGTCLDLAVLSAACLEQAGIHPLVVIIAGHAFPGAWLVDDCFADCAMDDAVHLRKRVDVGELCVFEATALTRSPACPVERALEEGRRHLDNPNAFIYAIDILRTRKSHIRPLPLRVSTETQGAEPQQPEAPTLSGPPSAALPGVAEPAPDGEAAPTENPAARLERWKSRLLDLTLRNRLLNFKETKKSLPILCPDLAALEDALAEGERFSILPLPLELQEGQPRAAAIHRWRTGKDLNIELLREELKAHRLRTHHDEAEMKRRLLEIYREARTSLEENGANTLYLALGFLKWRETPGADRTYFAPLLLLPLEIARRSIQEGFSITRGDDDPLVNTTLLELLARSFDIKVPGLDPLPQDEKGLDVPAILHRFREAVLHIDGWEVVEVACIGHFSFTKFLMWRDLEVRADDLQQNQIVSHLINTPTEPFPYEGEFPNPERLDETHSPLETFCPLSSDSSQLAAVYAAAEEKSFVLHGPPGTGKSQTITNLIAHALAMGKSVLFVSEKAAALNVVHERLKKCGLGPFCLALHSNKSHKVQVIRQLYETMECFAARTEDEWRREAARLAELRRELNDYAGALHRVRETGESAFQGMSRLIGLRDAPRVDLSWQRDRRLDRETRDQMREIARQLEGAARGSAHPSNNVWGPVECDEWSHAWRSDVEAAIQALQAASGELQRAAEAAAPLLHLSSSGWSEEDLENTFSVAKALLESPEPPAALVVEPDWDALNESVNSWLEHGRRRDALREQLYARYTEGILQTDLDSLWQRLASAEASWALPRALGRWQVRRALTRVAQSGQPVAAESLKGDLLAARSLRDEENAVAEAGDRARVLLGRFWREGEADWEEIARVRDWTASLRSLATRIAGTDLERAATLRQEWARLVEEGREQIRSDGPIGRRLQDFLQAARQFAVARQRLNTVLHLNTMAAWGARSDPDLLKTVDARLNDWLEHLDQLRDWCHWQSVRGQAATAGLQGVVTAYEQGQIAADQISKAFERSATQWWVEGVIDSEPTLRGFHRQDFERKIRDFAAIDERYTALTRSVIQARLAAQVPRPGDRMSSNSEVGILMHQNRRQRGHMPIRTLFQKIPNLLPRLAPCLLMSPLSVAQYLDPAHPPFDLVVFDEASQIPVWDAVGAIARGKEAIIVGDPKQLPPTNFFNRAEDDETSDESVVEDLESILETCIAAQLPELRLRWHYRSRHESLIAFSNYHYYSNDLLTFPSPHTDTALSLRPVSGHYDRSKARTNRAEADAVVAEIIARLTSPEHCHASIGVVTFSMAQQTLIEDLLEDARRQHPEIEPFFNGGDGVSEPVFVKNLENVQGDERDVILFSVCYGPDAQGRVSMNFGPLNRDGGERRLNVAITRARQEIVVFSTLRADQIDLSRTRAQGVADLKCFLDYAARGPRALSERREVDPGAECESPFEQQVCNALRERGYMVHPQVGCSRYRIDLGVVDPEHPGRYLLGIECDGATYHSAHTARDRDRLREAVLRDLGWRLHRVWSTDWWERPAEELARIEAAIEDAKKQRRQPAPPPPPIIPAAPLVAPPAAPKSEPRPAPTAPKPEPRRAPEIPVYVPYQVDQELGDLNAFLDSRSTQEILERLEAVIEAEGPVSLDLAARRVAACWGIRRVGHRVEERIKKLAPRARCRRTPHGEKAFLWPEGLDPAEYTGFRAAGEDPDAQRGISDIPPEEIANAALHVLKGQVSMPADDLIQQTGRALGFQRVGRNVREGIRAGIDLLCERGDACEEDGSVTLSK
jgi:very-short-patch-repair endonuclease